MVPIAISFAKVNTDPHTHVAGDRVRITTDVTLDNSYPTGGYAIAASTFGLTAIDLIDVGISPATGGVSFQYNYSTKKLMAFANTGAETTNATDLSTCTGRVEVVGKGTASYSSV